MKKISQFCFILVLSVFTTHLGVIAQDEGALDMIVQDSTIPEIPQLQRLENVKSASFVVYESAIKLHIDANPNTGTFALSINGDTQEVEFQNGISSNEYLPDQKGALIFLTYKSTEGNAQSLYHISSSSKGNNRVKSIPLWLSLVPPLIAILLALVFKEVVTSLIIGIWSGAFIAGGLRIDSIYWFLVSFLETVQKYVVNALTDSGHISVIVFSLLIGGMVAIISKNGGMAGVVLALSKYAKSPRSTQFITWLLGVAIFFDDYANTLIVGNTMRSVTDKFKISREKLAYIVDSTAAPVSAIFFITTWIGAELGYIDDGLQKINLPFDVTPYSVFISSLKYSFYPILTLIFMLILIYKARDFGPMFKAEYRAKSTGQVSPASNKNEDEPDMEDLTPVKNAPLKWYNAAIPVFTVILMTIFGLVDTGMQSLYQKLSSLDGVVIDASWSTIWANMNVLLGDDEISFFSKLGKLIGSSDSYVALLWASLSGVIMALILTLSQRIMSLFDSMHWLVTGFKTMLPALIILTLAWSLAITTDELHTAEFLSSSLENSINPYILPVIIFIMSAFIAFSTGSSWSTMAILYPIAIPTAFAICQANGLDMEITYEIILNVIATVLAASVLGDHCSPISDTTILSSLASDCNHLDHVKTQMPYALTVGAFSILAVGLSTFLGGGWMISGVLILCAVIGLYFIVQFVGKEVKV